MGASNGMISKLGERKEMQATTIKKHVREERGRGCVERQDFDLIYFFTLLDGWT